MSADTPLVFLDTETTGLDPVLDEVWEVAAIRREVNGTETRWQAMIQHDTWRAQQLPQRYRELYQSRWDPDLALSRHHARTDLQRLFDGGAHLVGANPAFDANMLGHWWDPSPANVCGVGHGPPWSYHLVDVEALAAGALAWPPGWDSHELSTALGVPERPGRHTAMVDALWARDLYDVVMDGLEPVPDVYVSAGDRVLFRPTSGDLPTVCTVTSRTGSMYGVGPVLDPVGERQWVASRGELTVLMPYPRTTTSGGQTDG